MHSRTLAGNNRGYVGSILPLWPYDIMKSWCCPGELIQNAAIILQEMYILVMKLLLTDIQLERLRLQRIKNTYVNILHYNCKDNFKNSNSLSYF